MSKILTLAQRAQIRLEMEREITTAVTLGLVKVLGEDASGKTLFALTEKGQQYGQTLMQSNEVDLIPGIHL